MADKVAWFEVVGQDGNRLRDFYGGVFGWSFQMPPESEIDYGMTDPSQTGIGGGVGTTPTGNGHATFYVEVDDPQATLDKIEAAGGTVVMPVTEMPMVTIAQFKDPQGNLVGLFKGQS
jgi:predicted enzyme related to lactoylglutathione lyase